MDQGGLFNAPISVSTLTRSARMFLEQRFPLQWIAGEISNFTRAASGHWYFTLKDADAQVRCTFFKSRNQWLDWLPRDGMAVEVSALVTLYEARAEFQLNVHAIRLAGHGALYLAFEQLKTRLAAEGLFATERKRALPALPKCIGIITSPAAAALRDVVTTLRRRMPMASVILYPTPVQGDSAAQRIAAAIELASRRNECDVLIVCRGGGSLEDLWCYNEEIVARAIAAARMPVISGVGHETDFTIADFVADVRAATPTGAAELASAQVGELVARLKNFQRAISRAQLHIIEKNQQTLDQLTRRLVDPRTRIALQRERLQTLARAAQRAMRDLLRHKVRDLQWLGQRQQAAAPATRSRQQRCAQLSLRAGALIQAALARTTARLETAQARLDALNPENVLQRGYAIVLDCAAHPVTDVAQLAPGNAVAIRFAHGHADARIEVLHPAAAETKAT